MIPRTFSPASDTTGPPLPDPSLPPRVHFIRAPQASISSPGLPAASVESAEAVSTSTRSISKPDTTGFQASEESQNGTGTIAKSILEYVFLAIAVIIVGGIIMRRVLRLKRTNQPLNKFFTLGRDQTSNAYALPRNLPRTTGLPPVPRSGGRYPLHDNFLAGVPAVYHPTDRRVRAFDTDARGRRLGGAAENDHDVPNDRDELPAYDKAGSPPQYIEALEMRILGMGDPPNRTSEDNRSGSSPVAYAPPNNDVENPPPPLQEDPPHFVEQANSAAPHLTNPNDSDASRTNLNRTQGNLPTS